MFKKILVPTDGSPLSDKAIEAATRFAQIGGSTIVGLSVAEPHPAWHPTEGSTVINTDAYAKKMAELAESYVAKVAALAKAANVPCEGYVAESQNPYEEIIRSAQKHACDVIFMASHGRKGLGALFIGSETHKVLSHSTIPVLVFR